MKKLRFLSLMLILIAGFSLFTACSYINPSVDQGKYYLVGSDSSYIEIAPNKKISFNNVDFSYIDSLNGVNTENNITDVIEAISSDGTFYVRYKEPYENLALRLKYYKDDKQIILGQYVYKIKE